MFRSVAFRSVRLPRTAAVVVALCAAVVLLLSGCTNSQRDSSGTSPASAAQDGQDGQEDAAVTVFAAASLKNVGDELAAAFVADGHPGARITWNYAGSSKLVQQIGQGAEADLFISADEENMAEARKLDEFRDADPVVVATNRLVLATAPGNPGSLTSLDDLKTDRELRIALCADGVPCGTLAHRYLDSAGVTLESPTEEANVSDVSTKVSAGDVDAGFIYSTDAQALQKNLRPDQGKVETFDIPGIEDNRYPAALTTGGSQNRTAQEFLDWLTTDRARSILAGYGFGAA
ncbi:molybdate ABC transporter substrate-binding protein [Corynebacterium neomassiliense]|uniref:molybdate ABC transporter substrate-binding protein n=1 Tax=Corynebacterium neomassiliense TaxID=2079482 RepID=UPI0010317F94|nr:molybdate ABC transporter substrate-binding protein [Corynebacterium neomassiliense]